LTDVSEVMINALMMEAVHTAETSVNFNVATRRYIPEDSKLQTYFHPSDDIYMSVESHTGMILTRKTDEFGENPVPVPLCPPQIPQGLI
jgi:hypothetical protein